MKKMRKCFLIIVLACIIAGLAFAAGPDTIVYITNTGEKYHNGQCSSVRNSKIAITLGEAVSSGFGPCQLCKPPVLDREEYSF
ncbi:MAG: hypothetical protein LBB81_00810 [Treponema sp.]|jgi:type IV secretory pathway protease TraF|nr:hypothetical protein [Treponema sp.]